MTDLERDTVNVRRDQLVVELDVLPHTLTPGRLYDFAGELIGSALFDSLFVEGREACEMDSGLVKRASPSSDFKHWTLEIEKDLSWSDGTPLTAYDVARAIEHLTDPQACAPLGWLADVFSGAVERRSGRNRTGTLAGCVATSAQRLELYLVRPLAYLPALLGASCFAPRLADTSAVASAEAPVSGPYRVVGALPHERGIVLELNRQSRQASSFSPQQVVFIKTDSIEQTLRLYEQDYIHITGNTVFPPTLIPRYKGDCNFYHAEMSMAAYLQPNPVRLPCFNEPAFRKAISLAIDRNAISALLNGAVRPLWRFTELWYPEDSEIPDPQPDAARALLRSVAGQVPPRIRLVYADFIPNQDIINVLAEQVSDVLGVHLDPQPLSYKDYLRAALRSDYDLLYVITPAAYQDPSSLLIPFRSGGLLAHQLSFADSLYDGLLGKAEALPDTDARRRGYREANDRLLSFLPVIPLVRIQSMFLRKSYLKGFTLRRSGIIPFVDIDLQGVRPTPALSLA